MPGRSRDKCQQCGLQSKNCKCDTTKEAGRHAQAKEQHYESAKEQAGYAKREAKDAGRGLAGMAKEAYEGVKEGVKETAKDVKAKASGMKEAAGEKYRETQRGVNTDESPNPEYDIGPPRGRGAHRTTVTTTTTSGPRVGYETRQYTGGKPRQASDIM